MADQTSQELIDEVLSRTDLRALVAEYVQLQRRGGRFFGLCPFHGEKTGSFSVSPEQGLFYCFGCGAGGSALQFMMRIEGWSFREALTELANRAGVRLPETGHRSQRDDGSSKKERETYLRVIELATKHFESQLNSGQHAAAADYLAKRGVDDATAKQFRLGYAPPGWEVLLRALRRNKVSERDVVAAGLALPGKRGGHYDRFRDRIMFPVVDWRSQVVGFSGRALGPTENQKYINSPELPYFKKGALLFGLQAAKEHFRKERRALLVEGNFDVVTLHSAGFRGTVAPMGTAVTADQVKLLRRFVDSVVVAFDGDEAGQRAMLKSVKPFYAAELEVTGAVLPADSDPDSFIREEGVARFTEILERARPLAELALDRHVVPAVGAVPEVRVKAARAVASVLELIPAGSLRDSYRQDVARRLELEVPRVTSRIRRDEPPTDAPDKVQPIALSERERFLIQILFDEPRLARRFCEEERLLTAMRKELRPFLEQLGSVSTVESSKRLERLVDELDERVRGGILEAVSATREYGSDLDLSYRKTIWQVESEHLNRRRARLQEEVRRAERIGDDRRLEDLWERIADLTREIATLAKQRPRVAGA